MALLFVVLCLGFSMHIGLANASIYDANVIQQLQLSGTQKQEMQKVISESRTRRNRIFKKHGIDPSAKPDMSLLQRASSELMANAAREREAAKRILNSEQLRIYDAVMNEIRERIMASF
ncbi:MAG: hypothetical protein ACREDW_02665 [Aestuariivirgaceae bacterium]